MTTTRARMAAGGLGALGAIAVCFTLPPAVTSVLAGLVLAAYVTELARRA